MRNLNKIIFLNINRQIGFCYQNRRCHQERSLKLKQKPNFNDERLIDPVRYLFRNASVIVSNLDNIYANLALEEWIYRNYDFSKNNEHILLLWHNRPSVVIGRHQNVWLEISVDYCRRNGIDIARRNSGGGTVYQDPNNLNVSFLTSRNSYNRTKNLEYIQNILLDEFQIETIVSPRKDLITAEKSEKISGTASKLNGHNAYHHCTLLVDVDQVHLSKSLRKYQIKSVHSTATKSVPSPVTNLKNLNRKLSLQSLTEALAKNFHKFYGGTNFLINQINPNNLRYFGHMIKDIEEMFKSWLWIYGSSPPFYHDNVVFYQSSQILLRTYIEKGCLGKIEIINSNPNLELLETLSTINSKLNGISFEEAELLDFFDDLLKQNRKPFVEVLRNNILKSFKLMTSAH
ncbi:Lipoyltransferase 1 [Sarcoptes scabiei]|uniref:Lipoyltransferase 1, mitochondrial n=1 Tax=Sarcoptes scabiei TaxID=52283 RepID=A0A834RAH0_SARSC|nr:Lipoyltransferase 1 [Sarcoptes scabiei]